VTAQDIADGMGLPPAEALKQAQALQAAGKVVVEKRGEKEYFRPA
jgi:predicted ArsR family transcriptional regulator